jgi:hypothetical protein
VLVSSLWEVSWGEERNFELLGSGSLSASQDQVGAGSPPLVLRATLPYSPSCIRVGFWRRNLVLRSRFRRFTFGPLLTFPPKGLTFWVPAADR